MYEQHSTIAYQHFFGLFNREIYDAKAADGLVLFALVFIVFNSFPCPNSQTLNQTERFFDLKTAMEETNVKVAAQPIQKFLKSKYHQIHNTLCTRLRKFSYIVKHPKKWEGTFTETKNTRKIVPNSDA